MQTKTEIRQALRKQRQSLSLDFRTTAASHIINKLIQLPLWQASQRIAVYLANDNEVDISQLFSLFPEKNYYLPVLTPSKQLKFAHFRDGEDLELNKVGIPEPKHQDILPAEELDLVCVPLVGFDDEGQRLGMGGGYYDRTFAFKKLVKHERPYLLGIAYECQKVLALPRAEWDVDLCGVLTEQWLYSHS